eukprot:Gregarina_sp_Poly_1__1402@NODE_1349_length_4315_cov_87_969868_g905_i0_p3_GENE_NODE_1349_length_4315_cov_87_969868_g905_i0NODE_1349_length_4315_cov_87_969868_g905_i0_p3_ORF_typecomplete_len224_score36_01Requiem_N/PF14051_6/0_11ATP1G1_PLM_MAT8/PF02038_16/0_6Use1/PF09753_9/4_6_NODE_1349_length_4315_cov_87_969868_g905_i030763747
MADIEAYMNYVEVRLGIHGEDNPRYWGHFPALPKWIPDPELWERAKKNLLRNEIKKLRQRVEHEVSLENRARFETRLKEIEIVGQKLYDDPCTQDSGQGLEQTEAKTEVVVAKRQPPEHQFENSRTIQREGVEDDYEGLSKAVQSVWNKATGWNSRLRMEDKTIAHVSDAQTQNVEATCSSLLQAKKASSRNSYALLVELGELIVAVVLFFLAFMMILLGTKP